MTDASALDISLQIYTLIKNAEIAVACRMAEVNNINFTLLLRCKYQ